MIVPNQALLSWLERQTGIETPEFDSDEKGEKPWEEISGIVRHIAAALQIEAPELFAQDSPGLESLQLKAAPRADDEETRPTILPAAVLGLFPQANQGLLRDMQAMVAGEPLTGPVESFVRLDASLEQAPTEVAEPREPTVERRLRVFQEERLVTSADPCQCRAIRLARSCKGLVIHGPPGTGKSQTITNIIADHLARGERVLFVCDKRTALDVVMNRLESIGLGHLLRRCARCPAGPARAL